MSESEVASYVLAYLMRRNYSQTARCFLNECSSLPSQSLLMLPQTPLETVIARHKSISDARVMVSTIGESSAWSALWSKLDTTLQQIRCLSEEMVANPSHGSTVSGRPKRSRTAKTNLQPSLQTSPVNSDPSQTTAPVAVQGSPHRRKTVPRRKVIARSVESAESSSSSVAPPPATDHGPPSPTMQQVLDTFLGDNTLPGKLADIINQCVSSGPDLNSELTSTTLDNIMNLTCSEPAIENLFTTHDLDHVTLESDHMTTSDNQSDALDQGHVTEGGPPEKRARLESDLPTEQDIDDFLDQLHKD